MLIYIARGADNADRDNLERIKALRALAPDVPLMILSDSQSREEIISTLNVGAQGFLYVGANAELALQAFSIMLNGGSYFPSAIRPKQTCPSQRYPARLHSHPPCVMGGGNGAKKDLEDAGPRNRSLTARQKGGCGPGEIRQARNRKRGSDARPIPAHMQREAVRGRHPCGER